MSRCMLNRCFADTKAQSRDKHPDMSRDYCAPHHHHHNHVSPSVSLLFALARTPTKPCSAKSWCDAWPKVYSSISTVGLLSTSHTAVTEPCINSPGIGYLAISYFWNTHNWTNIHLIGSICWPKESPRSPLPLSVVHPDTSLRGVLLEPSPCMHGFRTPSTPFSRVIQLVLPNPGSSELRACMNPKGPSFSVQTTLPKRLTKR